MLCASQALFSIQLFFCSLLPVLIVKNDNTDKGNNQQEQPKPDVAVISRLRDITGGLVLEGHLDRHIAKQGRKHKIDDDR